jgi:hypothetical protein
MKRLIAIMLLAVSAAACDGGPGDGSEGFEVRRVRVEDGRVIECIWHENGHQAGLSCNWGD